MYFCRAVQLLLESTGWLILAFFLLERRDDYHHNNLSIRKNGTGRIIHGDTLVAVDDDDILSSAFRTPSQILSAENETAESLMTTLFLL
jgi:hypothetical protein